MFLNMHEYEISDKIRKIPPPCKGTLSVWPPSRRTNWCSHFFGRVLTCQNCPALTTIADLTKIVQKLWGFYHTLCMILFVIFNQKICFIFGQIMSHLFIVRRCNILFDIQIKLVENDNNVSYIRNSLKEVSHVSWTLFVKIGHCASDVYLLEKNAYLELSCACLTTINNTTDCCSTTLPLF